MTINDLLSTTVFNNSIMDYIVALGTFILATVMIIILKKVILQRLHTWLKQTSSALGDFLCYSFEKRLIPLFYFGAFYLGARSLTLSLTVKTALYDTALILSTYFGVRFTLSVIIYALRNYLISTEADTKSHGIKAIITITKVLVWGFAILILLDNLDIKISGLLAGLGIGGIAIAFAAKAILEDMFSYFIIFFDRPFETGDFIVIGEFSGTVERIGVKTTRLRSLGGEQLIFSNTDLTNSRVRNYKRMVQRRIVFRLGVTYDTSVENLKEIPKLIADIIRNVNDTTFDRAHFFSYGDFSLIFEMVYYVLSNDYSKYMDIQQEVNLRIKEEFDKRGIQFAFPTQTIYLNQQGLKEVL